MLEVADHCKEALGRRYNDILSEQLRGAMGDIPEPHKIIAQTPFAAVVTTNYDKLLERSYPSSAEGTHPSRRRCAWPAPVRRELLHPQGARRH